MEKVDTVRKKMQFKNVCRYNAFIIIITMPESITMMNRDSFAASKLFETKLELKEF